MYMSSEDSSQYGFGLAEVLVSLAITSIGLAAIVSVVSNISETQRRLSTKQNMMSLIEEIASVVREGTLCKSSMVPNQTFNESVAAGTAGLQFNMTLPNGTLVTTDTELVEYGLTINRLYLRDTQELPSDLSGNKRWRSSLWGKFGEMAGRQSLLKPRLISSLMLTTAPSSNIIIDCSGFREISAKDLCFANKNIWNETTNTCETGTTEDENIAEGSCDKSELPELSHVPWPSGSYGHVSTSPHQVTSPSYTDKVYCQNQTEVTEAECISQRTNLVGNRAARGVNVEFRRTLMHTSGGGGQGDAAYRQQRVKFRCIGGKWH